MWHKSSRNASRKTVTRQSCSISCLTLPLLITGTDARLETLTTVRSSGMLCHVNWGYTKSRSIRRQSWYYQSTTTWMSGELSGTLLVTTTISPCTPNPENTLLPYAMPLLSKKLAATYLQVSGLHTTFITVPNPVHYIGLPHWSHSHYKMWSSPM